MKSRRSEISYADLQVRFHLPIKQSAVELGICTALLKKVCRSKGIRRWPHRKIRKIDKQIQLLLSLNPSSAHERQKLELEIASLRLQRQQIIDNPNSPDSEPTERIEPNSQLDDTPESDQLSTIPLSTQLKSFDSQELLVAQQLSMLQQYPISHRPPSVPQSTASVIKKEPFPSSLVAYPTVCYQQAPPLPQQIYQTPTPSHWLPQPPQQHNFPTISSLFETENVTQFTGKRQLISLPPIHMSQYAQPNPHLQQQQQPPPPLYGAPHGKPQSLPPLRIPELQSDQPTASKLSVLEPSV